MAANLASSLPNGLLTTIAAYSHQCYIDAWTHDASSGMYGPNPQGLNNGTVNEFLWAFEQLDAIANSAGVYKAQWGALPNPVNMNPGWLTWFVNVGQISFIQQDYFNLISLSQIASDMGVSASAPTSGTGLQQGYSNDQFRRTGCVGLRQLYI